MVCRFVLFTILVTVMGCGGVSSDQEESSLNYQNAQTLQKDKTPVKILRVINKTGKEKYDSLCHYIHIKTAQTLGDTNRYAVVSDDLIQSVSQDFSTTTDRPEIEIVVELENVLEYNGGTFKFAIFSTQQKRAEVLLNIKKVSVSNRSVTNLTGKGSSTKGAWGVLMSVDRDAMLRGKQIWKLDDSMVGIAAYRAIKEVILTTGF